jgi:hypothetical protein
VGREGMEYLLLLLRRVSGEKALQEWAEEQNGITVQAQSIRIL